MMNMYIFVIVINQRFNMILSKIRIRYKYLKHKILKSPRYLLTKRVISFLQDENDAPPTGTEREELIKFLRRHVVEIFNYPFMLKYHYRGVKIYCDRDTGLHYVLTDENRRLYFKRNMKFAHIRSTYNNLCMEQHLQSPHNYCFDDLSIHSDSIFADVGAAEGIFTLKFIDKIKTAYLFECDNGWTEALQATFSPWKEKVVIVNRFVSNKNNDEFTSLDHFFRNCDKPTLIKVDVEGAESEVLKGADKLLNDRIDHLLVCTYHQSGDEQNISELLREKEYKVVPSPRYMLMIRDRPKYSPEGHFEFRRGLIHASKL